MSNTPRPALLFRFAETPNFVDPRIVFTRATAGSYIDRVGVLKTAPAGVPRWTAQPVNGRPQGMLIESARTNLALYSQEFDNAAWTKTSASISSNSVAAPDGTSTADTITVSGASGNANQAITITAGNSVTISCHFKQLTSGFARLRITDGSNSVAAWFNLATGAVGSATAGATTCIYAAHSIEAMGSGWYRCQLTVATATSTAYTVHISAAAADSTEPANADSVYAWGAQAEQPGTSSAASAYIVTTSASATRNGDAVMIPTNSSWFNTAEGTMLLEWVGRPTPLSGVLGGVANAFGDHIYLWRASSTQLAYVVSAGSVVQAQINLSHTNVDGTTYRAAFAWAANDFAACVNAGTVGTDAAGTVPTSLARLGIGNAPWSSGGGTQPSVPFRAAAYWPRRLSDAVLQTLTA